MKNLIPQDDTSKTTSAAFERLYNIVRTLRGPSGCPWDKEQTPLSLRNHLLEEAYETVEAINNGDSLHTMEELGDVILVVLLIAHIEEQDGKYSVNNLIEALSEKLIRRHPHVFGEVTIENSDDVLIQWEKIKAINEKRGTPTSALDAVPKHLPSLDRAFKLQKKAAKNGFDWQDYTGVLEKIREELDEVEDEITQIEEGSGSLDSMTSDQRKKVESELGDVLFATINLARKMDIHPNEALSRTNSKFYSRFSHIENKMKESDLEMNSSNLDNMERFWLEAKESES